MNIIEVLVYSLVTWRLASLFVNEIGPFEMFRKIRDEYYNTPFFKKFINLDCVWCISVYIGWILALIGLGFTWEVFFYGLAFSCIAIIIESVVRFLIESNEKIITQQEIKDDGVQM